MSSREREGEGRRGLLTKSRVQHVQRHLVAVLCTCNGNKTLIAVIGGLVDLDDTATKLANLIDLRTALSDDGTNHVVGDEDLLCQGLAGHSTNRSVRGSSTVRNGRCGRMGSIGSGSSRAAVRTAARRASSIRHVRMSIGRLLRGLSMHVRSTISTVSGGALGWFLTAKVLWVRVLASSGLGNVWLDGHAAWDNVGRHSATSGILGRSGTTESLGQLLNQCLRNIVHSNVHSVSNTQNDQRALARVGEEGVRCIQLSIGSVLDLADANTSLANDGADKDVRDKQTHGIGLGGGRGRGLEVLLVESAHNETKGFGHSINLAAYSKYTFDSAPRVVANGTLGARQTTDLSHILSALANNGGCLTGADAGAHMQPVGLIHLLVMVHRPAVGA